MLATLLTLFACTVVILVGILFFAAPSEIFLLLLPAGSITFVISLLIGHFIAEPLRLLCSKAQAFIAGNTEVDFAGDGRLYEADCLADDFGALAEKAFAQQADLALRERRQSDFVSDAAHELRTPLTAIRGNAEMLLDPELPPELHEKFCSIIIAESERLSRLTNDLLTLQRIENDAMPSDLARIDLKNLAHAVIDALDPIIRRRRAHIEVTGAAPDILGNPDRIKQVLSNLVENASRFIEPGGHIGIDLFGMKGNAVIAVKDDGTGFGDIDPKLLFERFYRADTSRTRGTGGTGLGLAIVKSAVEAHDGTVDALNLPGGGACFIVAIPAISSE